MSYQDYLVCDAVLPQIPRRPDMNDPSSQNDETLAQYNAWWEAKAEKQNIVIPDIEGFHEFVRNSTQQFITGKGATNGLYSPVGLWLCLHTMSDLVDGDSRAQILNVTGRSENADEQFDALFRSLYWEDDSYVCVPAISVWLNKGVNLSDALLDRLSAGHSSVFQGSVGDSKYDQALRLWLNAQTRGLLNDAVSNLCFSPEDGLSVCSSLYMKCPWSMPFSKDETAPDVFYADVGEITTDFMHSSFTGTVYRGDGFSASILNFSDGGGVVFILPDVGISPEELLNSDDVFRVLFSGREWNDALSGRINLSVPQIDCLSELSMRSSLEQMGITDIFDPQKVQLSAEISSDSSLELSALSQYARLIMNEDGVEAAAITIDAAGALPEETEEEIDFMLNRPFLYAVMSENSIPLFIGTYVKPE